MFFQNDTSLNFSPQHVDSLHVSTQGPVGSSSLLHDSETPARVSDAFVSTNDPSESLLSTEEEISTTTEALSDPSLSSTAMSGEEDLDALYGDLSNTDSVSNSSLFESEATSPIEEEVEDAELTSIEVTEDTVKSGELQHDSPIFTYEQEFSSEQSEKVKLPETSKELTDVNLDVPPLEESNQNLKNVYIQQPNISNSTQAPATEPNVKIFEIPSSSPQNSSSKRVLVNVTISTDPDPQNPYQTHSIYVLSVSVPTDGHTESFAQVHEATKAHSTNKPVDSQHQQQQQQGGACECECPCLDGSHEFPDWNATEYYDYDGLFSSKEYNSQDQRRKGFTKYGRVSSTSTTESTSVSESSETWTTHCPEVTTKLPPPPTILILEGNSYFV